VPNGPPRAVHTIEHWNITAGMIGNDGVPRRIVMQHADDSERSTTLVSTAAAQRLAEVAGKLYEALLPFSYLEPPTGSGNDAYRLNAADLERAVDATEAFEAIMGGGGG
jgi:hypothetical protein